MIYLNSGFFKPILITISVPLIPTMIASLIWTICDFEITALILFLAVLIFYIFFALILYKLSKSSKYYLEVTNKQLHIKYPNVGCDEMDEAYIDCNKIVRLKYYKMSSLISWMLLFSYTLPQSAYIVYKSSVGIVEKHIGYMSYQQVCELAAQINKELLVYKALFAKKTFKQK